MNITLHTGKRKNFKKYKKGLIKYYICTKDELNKCNRLITFRNLPCDAYV